MMIRATAGVLAVGALAIALAACNVATSERVEMSFQTDATIGVRCSSALGYYALPKSYLRVRVMQDGAKLPERVVAEKSIQIGETGVMLVEHADPALTFCLDHINNPMSRDAVQVVKATTEKPSLPFLTSLRYNITDQTSIVVQALAKAAFIGISGNRTFPELRKSSAEDEAKPRLLADIEFDPFDARELARANRALSQHGQCVFVAALSVLPGEAERFCNAPDRYAQTPVVKRYAALPPADPNGAGVFYRPKMTMWVNVYERPPKSHAPWRLARRAAHGLSNLSPVLSLDLTRTPFANKIAHFDFDSGVLTKACISKGSEALGFVDMPLAITRDLVDLPANILSVRIDQTGKSRALVEAETNVIKAQQAMIAALQSGKYENGPSIGDVSKAPRGVGDPNGYKNINLSLSGADLSGFFVPNTATPFADASGCKDDIKID